MTYSMRPPDAGGIDHLLRQVDRVEHHLVQVLARFLQLAEQVLAHGAQLLAAELLIQIVRGAPQLLGAVVALELQDAVLHLAPVDDQDRQHAVIRQRHEFDLAQRGVALARQGHDAGEPRHARQHLRSRCDQRLGVVGVLAEARLDRGDLVVLERLILEQRVDEEPVALVGRDAAGRGVRRSDEAELFEIRHHVADGRRAQVQPEVARQRARADRLAVADIVLDQQLQQLLGALIQRFVARLGGHRRCDQCC